VSAARLSALDASFLAVERPEAPMHIGFVALFDAPADGVPPSYDELFAHLAARFERAPRYRQRLADVPLGLHDPVWVDDAAFDIAAHLPPAEAAGLDALVDATLSTPLRRDRPLWEMSIAPRLPDGGFALIGKMHHCMVDGAAVVELGNLILDADPDGWRDDGAGAGVRSALPIPSAPALVARAALDRAGDVAAIALAPARLAASPRRLARMPGAARTLAHTLLPPAPRSPLNQPGSARRHHIRATRPLEEIRAVRRRFGVTPNDVLIAACAGALRRYALRRGERPRTLKAMIPADVRSVADDAATGNRISFVFVELPCDEPDAVARLDAVNRATAQRARDGEADDLDAAFRAIARTPPVLQRALAQAFAHPRLWNLTISSVPGPAVPRYLRGCRLRAVHSAIPLTGRHALSIGVVTVAGSACFGLTVDADALPDADGLAADLDAAIDELVAAEG
jgi:WS/DGAT/MGAT family acyltransferase